MGSEAFVVWSLLVSLRGLCESRKSAVLTAVLISPLLFRSDIHRFFKGGPFPGYSDNGDATKMHHAYGLFIRALTHRLESGNMT
jgi:hypothetical protein